MSWFVRNLRLHNSCKTLTLKLSPKNMATQVNQTDIVDTVNSQVTAVVNSEIVWHVNNKPDGLDANILGPATMTPMTTNDMTGSVGSIVTASEVISDLNAFASKFSRVRKIHYREYSTITYRNGSVSTTWGRDETQVSSMSDNYSQTFNVAGSALGIAQGSNISMPTVAGILTEYRRTRENQVEFEYCTHAQHSNHKNRGRR